VAFERELERLGGLAKYVETRFAELAASETEAAKGYRTVLGKSRADAVWRLRRLGSLVGDTRFYPSGEAQALLLDRLHPQWKQKAMQEGAYLDDLLKAALEAASR